MARNPAWTMWNSFSELTNTLLELAHAPTEISEQNMHVIERFVILIYDRTSTSTDVNQARKKLFAKTASGKRIQPTCTALEQYVKQAAFQGDPVLPSLSSWG